MNSAFNILKSDRPWWLGGQVTQFLGSRSQVQVQLWMLFSMKRKSSGLLVSRNTLYKEPQGGALGLTTGLQLE